MTLMEANELPHAGIPTLKRLPGFGGREELPHIRSIRGAVAELKERADGYGCGECVERIATADSRPRWISKFFDGVNKEYENPLFPLIGNMGIVILYKFLFHRR